MITQKEFNCIVKDVMRNERCPECIAIFVDPIMVVMQDDTIITLYNEYFDGHDDLEIKSNMFFWREHYQPRVKELLKKAGHDLQIRLTNKAK